MAMDCRLLEDSCKSRLGVFSNRYALVHDKYWTGIHLGKSPGMSHAGGLTK